MLNVKIDACVMEEIRRRIREIRRRIREIGEGPCNELEFLEGVQRSGYCTDDDIAWYGSRYILDALKWLEKDISDEMGELEEEGCYNETWYGLERRLHVVGNTRRAIELIDQFNAAR